ncbi:hypothetical protein HZC31_05600 [Candidatus Woesearchaeota archaeon]|nr:hypothetical protein [Candidatus Woesearchaeota archaeon]
MASIALHKKHIKEHIEEINEAIDKGIEKRPATIGFHTSACSTELLELYLHKKNIITTGKTVKHNWFERPKAEQKIKPLIERKLDVDFPSKKDIYDLIYRIEENRDNLIYGNSKTEQIELVLKTFMQLKERMIKELKELGEDIE